MERRDDSRFLAIFALLALIIWLLTKSVKAASPLNRPGGIPVVSTKIYDSSTSIEVGYLGVRNDPDTIGTAVVPPGVAPNLNDNNFVALAKQGPSIPFCPQGYRALIDPENSGVYCTLIGSGGSTSNCNPECAAPIKDSIGSFGQPATVSDFPIS